MKHSLKKVETEPTQIYEFANFSGAEVIVEEASFEYGILLKSGQKLRITVEIINTTKEEYMETL